MKKPRLLWLGTIPGNANTFRASIAPDDEVCVEILRPDSMGEWSWVSVRHAYEEPTSSMFAARAMAEAIRSMTGAHAIATDSTA